MHLFEELNKLGTTIVLATHNKFLANNFTYQRLHLSNGTLNLLKESVPSTEVTAQSKELL